MQGKSKVIQKTEAGSNKSPFYCDKCEVECKDSNAWIEHLNSKRHNRLQGMSMHVEKVGVDRIKAKLASLKRKPEQKVETVEEITKRIEMQEQKAQEERELKKASKRLQTQAEDKALDLLVREEK